MSNNPHVLDVVDGGTSAITFTPNGVLFGNGTGAIQATPAGAEGEFLGFVGGTPSYTAAPITRTSTTVNFGDIAFAGFTTDIALVTIPTNTHQIAAAIETIVEGDIVATLTLSAGWFNTTDTIGVYDGLVAPPTAASTTTGNLYSPSVRNVRLYATSTVSNLDQMTQGQWIVRISYIPY